MTQIFGVESSSRTGAIPIASRCSRYACVLALLLSAWSAKAANGYLYCYNPGSPGGNIYGFAVNEGTGALTPLAGFPIVATSSGSYAQALALDRANGRIYSFNAATRVVTAYKLDPMTGAATLLPFSGFNFGGPIGNYNTIAVHPSGSPLLIGDFNSGNLYATNITATTATAVTGNPFSAGSNNANTQVFSADGNYYVGASGLGINPTTGVPTPLTGSPYAIAGGWGYAMDSSGRLFTGGGALCYVYTTANGIVSGNNHVSFTNGTTGFNPATAVIHPAGYYLFANDNSSSGFAGSMIISGSGASTTLTSATGSPYGTGGTSARCLALTDNGKFLYVGNSGTRNVSTFSVNASTGVLTSLGIQSPNTLGSSSTVNGMAYLPPVADLAYVLNDSASGNQIYAYATYNSSSSLIPLTGFPVSTGGNGDGTTGTQRLAIDRTNARLYALNKNSNTVSAYSINSATGVLSALPYSPFSLGAGTWNALAIHPSGSPLLICDGGSPGRLASYQVSAISAVAAGSPAVAGPALSSGTFSADGNFFYAGGDNTSSAFAGFSVDPSSGVVTALAGSPFDSGNSAPGAFVTDATGRIFLANPGGQLRAFSTTSGIPDASAGNPFSSGLSGGTQGVLHSNGFYLVADNVGNGVGVYQISGSGGGTILSPVAGSPFAAGGSSTGILMLNQRGDLALAANATTRNLTAFRINAQTGVLAALATQASNTVGAQGYLSGMAMVAPSIDLKVTVSASASVVVAGSGAGNLSFTITVLNNGAIDSSGVALSNTQTLPAGATFDSATAAQGTSYNSGTGIWTVGALSSGASATLTITNTVGSSSANGTSVTNTASVTQTNENRTNTADDSASAGATVSRSVDLTVTVVDAPDPIVAGSGAGNLVYTVTVKNNGPSNASGVQLTNTQVRPPGVTLDSGVGSAGTTFVAGTGIWTVGNLAAGATATLTVTNTVTIAAAQGASVSDTGTVTATIETRINPGDDSATATTGVVRTVDLSLAVTDMPHTVVAGSGTGNLVYAVTLTNNGPFNATGVAVTNTQILPAGVAFVSGVGSAGTSFNGASGIWTVGNLTVGSSATLTVTNTVSASAAAGANAISNTATISASNETRILTGDDSVTQTTSIARNIDLALTAVGAPPVVVAGGGPGNLVYSFTLTNNGPSDASDVQMLHAATLPAGFAFDGGTTTSAGTYDPNESSWIVPSLTVGSSATLTLSVAVPPSATPGLVLVQDSALVIGSNESRVNLNDDGVSISSSVTVNRVTQFQYQLTDSPHVVAAGTGSGNLIHTYTLKNVAPSDASNAQVSINVILPAGVSLDSGSGSAGTNFNLAATTWTISNLVPGDTATLALTFTVGESAVAGDGAIETEAAATTANGVLLDPGLNTISVSSSIVRQVDLTLAVPVSPVAVIAGSGNGNLSYTLVLTNNGPIDAASVQVSVTQSPAPGVVFLSAAPSNGTVYNSVSRIWFVPSLPKNAGVSLTVMLTVGPATMDGAAIVNSAQIVSATETLVNTGDDAVLFTVLNGRQIDLAVSVADAPHVIVAGSAGPDGSPAGNLVYTVTVKNNGPSDATGVTLSNTQNLPAGVSFVSSSAAAGTSFDSNAGVWTVGALPNGASVTLMLTNTVAASAAVGSNVISDTAAVAASTEVRINPADDTATQASSISFAILSGPFASPTQSSVGQNVTFDVMTTASGVQVAWDFGDGTAASGTPVMHAFPSAGVFVVTATLTDGFGGIQTGSVTVTVSVPQIGSGVDTDGDGFSDSFEQFVGSDPLDPMNTPTGIPLAIGDLSGLTLSKSAIVLKFTGTGKDSIQLAGSLSVPTGFAPQGKHVYFDVGGVLKAFTLDSKGTSKNGNDRFKFLLKSKARTVGAQTAGFTAVFSKGSFAAALADEGLTGDSDLKDAKRSVRVTLVVDTAVFQKAQPLLYSSKKGKSGSAK